ncbi:hypothetical protein ACOME3_006885 [Neoechinorhynchus agilis]
MRSFRGVQWVRLKLWAPSDKNDYENQDYSPRIFVRRLKTLVKLQLIFSQDEIDRMEFAIKEYGNNNYTWVIDKEERKSLLHTLNASVQVKDQLGEDLFNRIINDKRVIEFLIDKYSLPGEMLNETVRLAMPSEMLKLTIALMDSQGDHNRLKELLQKRILETGLHRLSVEDLETVMSTLVDGLEKLIWQDWSKKSECVWILILMGGFCLLRQLYELDSEFKY